MSRTAARPAAERYLFERGFQAAETGDAAAAASFTADDVERARAEARAVGRADAVAEMTQSDERRIAIAVEAIVAALAEARRQFDNLRTFCEAAAVGVAAAITRKMLPEFYRREGANEIMAMVTSLLPTLLDSPKLTLRLNGVDCERLAKRLQEAAGASGFDGRLLILADAGIAVGDCRVEWAHGGASRDGARLWQDIEATLAAALPAAGARQLADQTAGEGALPATNGGEHV